MWYHILVDLCLLFVGCSFIRDWLPRKEFEQLRSLHLVIGILLVATVGVIFLSTLNSLSTQPRYLIYVSTNR